ncbi:hypothetical protein CEUSTIGMA_g8058.t1 [Chlamydomonas eustigma]|uniref:K Homology domain-containing protein n=1 Tax=Chlamydomonas eustigma TaxID=1157962 RepID=A0A250XC14_9CHLO|nr:hypothetical protein CEUSTIGMA_g8058.t1 [Chlamydomonas eustigma]|eukprot:GAX80623.1 hypothetical protein CEUSTIGMA_g8058.t1 [Chlamydomonas eustigma]
MEKKRKWDVVGPDPPSVTLAPVPAATNNTLPGTVPSFSFAGLNSLSLPPFVTFLNPQQLLQPRPVVASTPTVLTQDAVKLAQEAAMAVANKFQDPSRAMSGAVATSSNRNIFEISREDDIMARTGTLIITKGRYYPPGVARDEKEKPIYLKITPGNSVTQTEEQKYSSVNNAAQEIEKMIRGGPLSIPSGPPAPSHHAAIPPPPSLQQSFPPTSTPTPAPNSYSTPAPIQSLPAPQPLMVFVNMPMHPPDYGLAQKINGPGGAYLAHIANSSGSQVQLRGRGSVMAEGPDPLHIYIAGPTQKAVEDAKSLALDLLKTVKDEFSARYPHLAPGIMASTVAAAPPPAVQNVPPYYPTHPQQHPHYPPPHAAAINPYAAQGYSYPPQNAMPHPQHVYPGLPNQHHYPPPNPHASYIHPQQTMIQQPHQSPAAISISAASSVSAPAAPVSQDATEVQAAQPSASISQPSVSESGTPRSVGATSVNSPPRKRSFREFTEAPVHKQQDPEGSPQVPQNPYAHYINPNVAAKAVSSDISLPSTSNTMGPPPPLLKPGSMGPPPPRAPTLSSAPPVDSVAESKTTVEEGGGGLVTGSLAGLVAYGDDDEEE